eukprot:TRINITY_DN5335_c0_g1_i1.p1 TRINITY_DN5335_c0_g1~~TRINITY_DN5335_c0_g1_i1.p1  ORF type:complete len:706 (+),score=154.99 TRINITY_DN5335_c0_g1_i1:38-2119(+)
MLAVLAVVATASLRPPSVPLMVHDPYTSFWSPYDKLYESFPERWNGWILGWNGMVQVDNDDCLGWMGNTFCEDTVRQTALKVTATKTTFAFTAGTKVKLTVSFRTPSAIEETPDYTMMTLPTTYMDYTAESLDGSEHQVSVYFDATGEATISNRDNNVTWSRGDGFLSMGNVDQTFHTSIGNDINWGYFNIGYDRSDTRLQTSIGNNFDVPRKAFYNKQTLPDDKPATPTRCIDGFPVNAVVQVLSVAPSAPSSRHLILGYDQGDTSISYFGTKFPSYWKHVHGDFKTALNYAVSNYADVNERCDAFDAQLTSELTNAGTAQYAEMGSLIYRQVTGSMTAAWNPVLNETWIFLKEISSAGDVSTVDVIFPSSPMLLYYDTEMVKKLILPIFTYANNGTAVYGDYVPYNLPWAPHHLGHWPMCNLPEYRQEQMPVEETGNLLILANYIAQEQKDLTWLGPWWGIIDKWGKYLPTALPDPKDQLCTDDFEGPSPHNVNLAAKGIIAMGAYSQLLTMRGNTTEAGQVMEKARQFMKVWVQNGTDPDESNGIHTKLQYNLNSTWSQKYNLLWDGIFDLSLVPSGVLANELAFYMTKMNEYGVPLDDRATFTKLDWSMWIAAMAPQEQFVTMSNTIYKWTNETTTRVPFSDWTETTNLKARRFKARPVMGGFWAKMLLAKKQKKIVKAKWKKEKEEKK